MLAQLARSLAAILEPLDGALADPRRLELLLTAAGWQTSQPVGEQAVDAAGRALGVTDDLRTLLALGDGTPTAAQALGAVDAGSRVLGRLVELATADGATAGPDLRALADALPPPLDDADAVLLALGDVGAALVSQWLGTSLPPVRSVLRAAGVSTGSSPERIEWPALLRLFSEPRAQLADTTGWGGQLSLDAVDRAVRALADLTPRPITAGLVDPDLATRHWGPDGAPPGVLQYSLTILDADAGDVGLVLVPVPEGPDADPAATGLLLAPIAGAGAAATFPLGDVWSASVTAGADLDGTFGLLARPAADGAVTVTKETGAPALDVAVALTAPAARWTLGDPGGPQLMLEGVEITLGIRDDAEPYVAVGGTVRLTLAPPDGNGFLRSLLGDAADVGFDIAVDISTSGVRLAGAATLAFTVPLDRELGPLHLDTLDVEFAPGADELALDLRLAAELPIGPVIIAEEGLGAALAARSAPDGDGTLGELDLALALLEPTRLVVTIDSDAVTGGGFVEHDPETGRYAGGLAIDVLGLGISAIVVVDTQIPGDADGWALLASLGLTFPAPIPLGFGFTLIGVGGLLALHRTMNPDALAAGLKTGAADAVLFPDDIEADAEQLLAQLDAWFPLKEGSTTVGPVLEIGWGSPTIVSAQIGVVIVVPDLLIAVLGSVEVLLPTPDEPLLSLRMDVTGAVDLPAGTVTVAASLHDSNLLGSVELSGDMGFYASVGDQPLFLLSVGGYHPDFDPPGALPSWLVDLRRMRASLALGEDVEAVLTAYVAVTSNTLQFGGSLRLVASAEVLTTYTADGWFSVNVLLSLTPFRIVTSASAGVTISAGDQELMGVDLRARVEGPQPWYASGHASFTFFGLDVDFGFQVGDRAGGEPRERHDVGTDARVAMQEPAAWSAVEPADAWGSGVLLADERPAGLWVRPDQRVEVRQSVAPLNRTITRFGEFLPTTDRIDAGDVRLGGAAVTAPDWLQDWFAPGQFDELEDTSRLSAPSYELMTAGVRFGDEDVGVPAHLAADCASVSSAPEQSIWPDGSSAPSPVAGPLGNAPGRPAARTVDGPVLTVAPTRYVLVREIDGRRVSAPGPYSVACAGRGGSQRVAPAYASTEQRAA